MATSHNSFRDTGAEPVVRALGHLDAAAGKTGRQLREAHVNDYQRLYRRVEIELVSANPAQDSAARSVPTNQRVAEFGKGNDPGLAALHFQFGRYLLISCSRQGGQPATLQGLLERQPLAAVGLQVHHQHQYRDELLARRDRQPDRVLCAALCDDRRPFDDRPEGRKRALWRGRLGLPPQHRPVARRGSHRRRVLGMWPMGGAWLCKSFWDHYEFTRDVDALRSAYPIVKGAAEFFLDALVPEPTHGWLVTCPSVSPENGHHDGVSICAGPTMDMQILRDLFDAVADWRRSGRGPGLSREGPCHARQTRADARREAGPASGVARGLGRGRAGAAPSPRVPSLRTLSEPPDHAARDAGPLLRRAQIAGDARGHGDRLEPGLEDQSLARLLDGDRAYKR